MTRPPPPHRSTPRANSFFFFCGARWSHVAPRLTREGAHTARGPLPTSSVHAFARPPSPPPTPPGVEPREHEPRAHERESQNADSATGRTLRQPRCRSPHERKAVVVTPRRSTAGATAARTSHGVRRARDQLRGERATGQPAGAYTRSHLSSTHERFSWDGGCA